MTKKKYHDEYGNQIRSRPPKRFFQKWWMWLIVAAIAIVGIAALGGKEEITEEPAASEIVEVEEEDTAVQDRSHVENEEENKAGQFNELPLETQFVVINSLMDTRMLGASEMADAYIHFVTYYEDIQRLSYQLHSGAGTGHPINHWTIYEDEVVFEVAYVGSGAAGLIRQLPENEYVATIQKTELFDVYLRFQNRYDLWEEKVEIEFADESEENSEEIFDEFAGTTSTEFVDFPSPHFLEFAE